MTTPREAELQEYLEMAPFARTAWILECGCEPHTTHCAQCDHRRSVRTAADALDAIERAAQYLRQNGYGVSKLEAGEAES